MVRTSLVPLLLLLLAACARATAAPAAISARQISDSPYLKAMWSVELPATTLVAATDRIVAQGPQGLTALDTWSNTTAWTDKAASSGRVFVESSTIYVTVYNGLQAYDLESGKLFWQTWLASGNARGISADGRQIFLTDQYNRFLVLDKDGHLVGWAPISAGWTPLALEDGKLIYADTAGLHALNVATKQPAWDMSISGIRSEVGSGKAIYLLAQRSSRTDAIYAVDRASGRVLWKWNEQARVVSNLCLLDSSLFYLTADDHLAVLTTITGNEVARIAFTKHPLVSNGPSAPVAPYQIAADPGNEVLAIAFGDTHQVMALKLLGRQDVFIEKPLYR